MLNRESVIVWFLRLLLAIAAVLMLCISGIRVGYGDAVLPPKALTHAGCSTPCAEGIQPGAATQGNIDVLLQTGRYRHVLAEGFVTLWGHDDADEVIEVDEVTGSVRHVTTVYSRRCTMEGLLALPAPDEVHVIDEGDMVLLVYADYQLSVLFMASPGGMNVPLAHEVMAIRNRVYQYNQMPGRPVYPAVNLFDYCRG